MSILFDVNRIGFQPMKSIDCIFEHFQLHNIIFRYYFMNQISKKYRDSNPCARLILN